jgi:hypothetical protein
VSPCERLKLEVVDIQNNVLVKLIVGNEVVVNAKKAVSSVNWNSLQDNIKRLGQRAQPV